MVARDNYSYKKYQKELAQKKKREEKLQSKLDKKNKQTESLASSDGKGAPIAASEPPADAPRPIGMPSTSPQETEDTVI
jgi:hypothetical protein